jgi:divalent metal cation (Fe/Co/Zn/Cd) transporter
MTSEAIHSVVDTTNEILLLYGIHRSKQNADADHPFGHGREIYFWSFVVSLLIFALGAGFSIYQGVSKVLQPVPIESPVVSYVVFALAFVFEGGSWLVSLRQFSGEWHLRRVLSCYLDYYNEARTDQSLGKDTPVHRPV